jgi:hypothetical protein
MDIPGVVPVVYPITGFELGYGLYALCISGLLEHPLLVEAVRPKIAQLWDITVAQQGTSFGEGFVPDVDSTGVAVSVLAGEEYDVDADWVLRFKKTNHFVTFVHELNPSVFSNAHAVHALSQLGLSSHSAETFILQRQLNDGRWLADKWHSSWRYTTLEVLVSLSSLGYGPSMQRAQDAILRNQRADGSWSLLSSASLIETVYSLMALYVFQLHGMQSPRNLSQLHRAEAWLLDHCTPHQGFEMRWLGKENYSPIRVDYLYQLSALMTCLNREDDRGRKLHEVVVGERVKV